MALLQLMLLGVVLYLIWFATTPGLPLWQAAVIVFLAGILALITVRLGDHR